MFPALPLPDLNLILRRTLQQLNGEVKDLVINTSLEKLISIYKNVMEERQKKYIIPSYSVSSSDLLQEIIVLLQEEVSAVIAVCFCLCVCLFMFICLN